MHINLKKSIVIFAIVSITLLLSSCVNIGKPVPEFRGIEISKDLPDLTKTFNQNNENNKQLDKQNLSSNSQTFENKIEEYLGIPDTINIDYYPKANEDIYIRIKIYNPANFSIATFKLNEDTYYSHQFYEGSDKENLLLMINVGEFEGIRTYTVDEIYYFGDGDIFEVKYSGNNTASIGIKYSERPTARVNNRLIDMSSISFDVNVTDPVNVIEETGKILKVLLYDGNSIIKDFDLNIGNNKIIFDKLIANRTYQYAVVACLDFVDGLGNKIAILWKDGFDTKGVIALNNVVPELEAIAFNIDNINLSIDSSITSIEIYQDDKLIESLQDLEMRSFNNLLSNTSYKIIVHYKYDLNDGTGEHNALIIRYSKTKAKNTPYGYFMNEIVGVDSISFDMRIIDKDNTGELISIQLFKDGNIVQNLVDLTQKEFKGLESNTEYHIIARYSYDLNDGKGENVYRLDQIYKTYPRLDVRDIKILNEKGINYYQEVSLKIDLYNPDNVYIVSFIISGEEISAFDYNPSTKILKYYSNFPGGLYVAKVEAIKYGFESWHTVTIELNNDIKYEIFYYGEINADQIYNDNNIIARDVNNFFNIKFFNPTGYYISGIEVFIDGKSYSYSQEEIISIDKETIKIPWKGNTSFSGNENAKPVYVNKFTYGFSGKADITIINENIEKVYFYIVEEITPREIRTVNDLLNIESGYYYKLINDIDLEGHSWVPLDFNGCILGEGKSIKNLKINIEAEDIIKVGMFSTFRGKIDNLHLDNILINISGKSVIYVGGIAGVIDDNSLIRNCTISGKITVNNFNELYVGGIAGLYNKSNIINSFSDVESESFHKIKSYIG